jgi:undecaprenyl diphosphate synthase
MKFIANATINHLAVIMDGNSRWAEQNNLPSYLGHKEGTHKAKLLIELAIQHEIKHLSLFAFSTENWSRPKDEVEYILELFYGYLNDEIENLIKNKIKLSIIGDLTKLSSKLQNKIQEIQKREIIDPALKLYINFSYGGKQEIVDAARKILSAKIDAKDITIENFNQFLYAPDMPDIDLVIRTGGNQRISNFLPWHIAYAELYFLKKYWPDFNEEDLKLAIDEYKKRLRTFGAR